MLTTRPKNTIPIVFASDNKYSPYLCVAVASLIKNISKKNTYEIIILESDISTQNKNAILSLTKKLPNVSASFINMQKKADLFKDFLVINHLAIAAYYRLLIASILPQYDKIIYLDCDLIINTDIANLFKIDIKNNYLAATKDLGIAKHFIPNTDFADYIKNLGMKNPENYFNSGVLIMNLKEIRKNNLEQKFLQIAKINNRYFHDQNVLNVCCENKTTFLDLKWNVPSFYKELSNHKTTLSIIHYCSSTKPWNTHGIKLQKYFWKYAKTTPLYKQLQQELPPHPNQKLKHNIYKTLSTLTLRILGIKKTL